MRMIEADAKQALRRAGLPVPGGAVLLQQDAELAARGPVVLKAQLLEGGRGKAGLIKLVQPAEAPAALTELRRTLAARGESALVWVEDQVAFQQECYLGWRIDDLLQQPVLMFSPQGGVEIESQPESLRQLWLDPLQAVHPHKLVSFLRECGVSGRALGAMSRFAAQLYQVFRAEDADLLEINPLVITADGGVVALDCKLSVDNAALSRHPDWLILTSYQLRHAGRTPLEVQADEAGVTFVDMSGNVALLSSGAGLGMALVDMIAESGFRAANFCDAVGGSGMMAFTKLTELVFERARDPEVVVIAAFFTLAATSLKAAVISLINAVEATPPPKPMVVGFAATGAAEREMTLAEAVQSFKAIGYECVTNPAELMIAIRQHMSPSTP